MTRIKYERMQNTLVTNWLTVGPNQIIRGVIHPDNTIDIVDIQSNILKSISNISNKRKAKDLLKKELRSFGFNFEEEIRNNSTTP